MSSLEDPASPQGVNYRGIMIQLGAFTVILALGGVGLGYLAKGSPGLWGGLLGAAVTGVFFATSALMMHLGRRGGPTSQMRNLVVSWMAKLVILFIAFVALERATWLHPKVFGLTIMVGVIGSLLIEGRAVFSARIGLDDQRGR